MGILDKLLEQEDAVSHTPTSPSSVSEYRTWVGKQCTGIGLFSGELRTGQLGINSSGYYMLRNSEGHEFTIDSKTLTLTQQEQTREGYLEHLAWTKTLCTGLGLYDKKVYRGALRRKHNKTCIIAGSVVSPDSIESVDICE